MADVSSIGPRIHTDDRSAALEDILITSELACRPPRAPDYASENRALVALAHAMAIDPHNLPQSLVDMAIDLCQAGTAGISVLKTDADGEYLAWEALAGVYATPINGPIPRHFSPCGDVPDWNTPQLFSYPARYFTDFAEADAPIVEALVVALYGSGQPLGMLWLMAHDEQRHFDAEDVRLMTSLAAFASAALRTSSILETEAQANQARGVREEPRKATPKASLAAGVGPGWPVVAPQHTGEWQFRRLLEKLPAGAYTCDPDGLITYFNPQAVELWGRPPKLNDPVDRFCGSFKLFATDGTPIAHDQCWMALVFKMNQEYNGREIVIERPDGQRLTVLAYANPIHDEAGKLLGAVNVLVDITARKQAEAHLEASLREKEVLLKEVHHRVKNNLQVIASLLSLQSNQLKDHDTVVLFEDIQNRVKSMALIHESLYRTGDLARFNIAGYIESLSSHLFQSFAAEASGIRLHLELDDLAFDVDTAIPCGLILNELLTNTLKHAFPSGRAGDVYITLQAVGEHVRLSVRDNGIGFPPGVDFRNTESLGLQLVGMLTEQLGGTLTLIGEDGTAFTVSIPYSASLDPAASQHGR